MMVAWGAKIYLSLLFLRDQQSFKFCFVLFFSFSFGIYHFPFLLVLHYKKANEKIPARETKTMMAFEGYLLLGLLVLLGSLTSSTGAHETVSLNRSSFPAGFIFGTASSSYQVNLS